MARYWFAALVLALGGVAFSQTMEPTTSPAFAPTTSPTTVPSDASTPRGAMRMLFIATDAGNEAQIRSLLYTASPTEEKLADTMAQMSSAKAEFQNALKKAFGDEQTKAAFGDPQQLTKMRDEFLGKLTETIKDDTATVQMEGSSRFAPVEFKNEKGTWKLRVGKSLEGQDPAAVQQQLTVVGIQIKVYKDMAADVLTGKYKSIDDVNQTLEATGRKAMMEYVQSQNKATTGPTTGPATQP